MREAELVGVRDELLRQLLSSRARAATTARAPRRSRAAAAAARGAAALEPVVVAPFVARRVDRWRQSSAAPRRGRRTGRPSGADARPRRAPRTCTRRPRRHRATTPAQMPDEPSSSSWFSRPSQRFQSPTTETLARVRRPDGERDAVARRRGRRGARRAARAGPRRRGGDRARRARRLSAPAPRACGGSLRRGSQTQSGRLPSS